MYELPVGTDLSRPFGLSTLEQGRDKSVPTGVCSRAIFSFAETYL